jgi:hypothetical protein
MWSDSLIPDLAEIIGQADLHLTEAWTTFSGPCAASMDFPNLGPNFEWIFKNDRRHCLWDFAVSVPEHTSRADSWAVPDSALDAAMFRQVAFQWFWRKSGVSTSQLMETAPAFVIRYAVGLVTKCVEQGTISRLPVCRIDETVVADGVNGVWDHIDEGEWMYREPICAECKNTGCRDSSAGLVRQRCSSCNGQVIRGCSCPFVPTT